MSEARKVISVPTVMHSSMTGRYYVVTDIRNDGSAKTKYDCTEEMESLIEERTSSLETALRTVTRERDEQKALVAAKDEALREITEMDDEFFYTVGYHPTTDIPASIARKALSLTPADALKRQEAERRVVEAARKLDRLKKEFYSVGYQMSQAGVWVAENELSNALAALEVDKP